MTLPAILGVILSGLSALLLPVIFKASSRGIQSTEEIQKEMNEAVEMLKIAQARVGRAKEDVANLVREVESHRAPAAQ
jgi:hypothetical protein